MAPTPLQLRRGLDTRYADVFTPAVLAALADVSPLDADRRAVMRARLDRRAARARSGAPIDFLDAEARIARTSLTVGDARRGAFAGSVVPADLRRQWIQGTGPAARPNAAIETSIRNVAYALLSGADGWMFDGEDALGQVSTMSLDNQRNLKLAIHRDPLFMAVAEQVADGDERLGRGVPRPPHHPRLGRAARRSRRRSSAPRGLHLDDRHLRHADGSGFSASIVDVTLYLTNNHGALQRAGASLVLYLPKIQTAEEAALWNDILAALEQQLGARRRQRQGLRARRADRGVLSADGDPRGTRQALRRFQHRPVGLHQQRVGRDGVGSRRS